MNTPYFSSLYRQLFKKTICTSRNGILFREFFLKSEFNGKIIIRILQISIYIVKIILLAITYPVLFYIFKNFFRKVITVIDSDIWKYIWIIPLMFSIIGAIYSPGYSKENTSEFSFIFLRYLIFIGTFFTCFVLLKTLKQTEINTRLEENISIHVDLKIPNKTFVANLDFCILLGNCLENAIDACKKIIEGEKFISIKSQMTNYMIGLTIDNSFSGEILKEDNAFVSTKKSKDHGIGISSIHSVVSKYDGIAKFEVDTENMVFRVSILLKNTPNKVKEAVTK